MTSPNVIPAQFSNPDEIASGSGYVSSAANSKLKRNRAVKGLASYPMGRYPVMKNPRAPMSAKSKARFSIFITNVKIAQQMSVKT